MKIGFLLRQLDQSQQGLLLTKTLNRLARETLFDPFVFYRTHSMYAIPPNFALLQEHEVWNFDGPVISTTLEMTKTLINAPKPPRKIFYPWDLEWLYAKNFLFEDMRKIYCHDEIYLIARSESHLRLLSNCWKNPIAVWEDFEYNPIVEWLTAKLP
jgi:hypothetical protein